MNPLSIVAFVAALIATVSAAARMSPDFCSPRRVSSLSDLLFTHLHCILHSCPLPGSCQVQARQHPRHGDRVPSRRHLLVHHLPQVPCRQLCRRGRLLLQPRLAHASPAPAHRGPLHRFAVLATRQDDPRQGRVAHLGQQARQDLGRQRRPVPDPRQAGR
ncbi:hypothetical protein BCR44DRAFT_331436 [Catenaria anguillulae PL171]|uniref:Uncharacterized protein n=1 Tax=Catenaria anguillulae PL171 TaxID=765915 RepID=A0A1Y2HL21_9FUNG|nr:hypothetical protein BCR44DRAFT_331436 [Catenaria anguillulae PL171]